MFGPPGQNVGAWKWLREDVRVGVCGGRFVNCEHLLGMSTAIDGDKSYVHRDHLPDDTAVLPRLRSIKTSTNTPHDGADEQPIAPETKAAAVHAGELQANQALVELNEVLDLLLDAVRPAGVIVNVSIWGHPATVDSRSWSSRRSTCAAPSLRA